MRKPLPLSPKAGSTKTYGMPPPWKRRVGIASAILLVSFLVAFVPAIRTYVLRSAGRALVLGQHSTTRADIIIVAIDADGAGVLEAADLVAKGVAARVAAPDFADLLEPWNEPEDRGELSPVRKPYSVQLTAPIVVFRTQGRIPNTILLQTLP